MRKIITHFITSSFVNLLIFISSYRLLAGPGSLSLDVIVCAIISSLLLGLYHTYMYFNKGDN